MTAMKYIILYSKKKGRIIMTKEEIKNVFDEKVTEFLKYIYKDLDTTPQVLKDLEALKQAVDNEWIYINDFSDSEVRKRILKERRERFIKQIKSDNIIQAFNQFFEQIQKTKDELYSAAKDGREFISIAEYFTDSLWEISNKIDFYIEYIHLTKE